MDREIWEKSGYLASVNPLYEFVRETGLKVTKAEVKSFLDRQRTVQVLRQPRRPAHYSTIWASKPDFQWMVDVTFPTRPYQGYKAILMLVDVHSRKLAAVPLTSREQTTSLFPAFMQAIKQLGSQRGYPENVNADREFESKQFLSWGKKNGVTMYFSNPDEADVRTKMSIVERMNGTLLRKLEAYGRAAGRVDWPKFLPTVVTRLNNTTQSTIHAKPSAVYSGTATNNQSITRVKQRFAVGQRVRLRLKRETFQKGSTAQNYSDEIYVLEKMDEKQKNRWWLRDIKTKQMAPRPYAERDLSIIYDVDPEPAPVRRVAAAQRGEDDGRTARNRTKREQNQLRTSVRPPSAPKRKSRRPTRYDD